jgi:hypothetical protein
MPNGSRIFDVKMEDVLVFDGLDIYQAVGGNFAYIKSTQLNVNDGFVQAIMHLPCLVCQSDNTRADGRGR